MSDNTVCRAGQFPGGCLCFNCRAFDASKWVVAPEMTKEQAIKIITEETSNSLELASKHYDLMSQSGFVDY